MNRELKVSGVSPAPQRDKEPWFHPFMRREAAGALVLSCCLICLFIFKADAQGGDWRLIFRDGFDAQELRDEWSVVGGNWKVFDGKLFCHGRGLIVFNNAISGLQRIEFRAGSNNPGDLSPILHFNGQDLQSGYFLPFGGLGNSLNKGERLGEPVTFEEDHRIEKGKDHQVMGEFDGQKVRLEVDGEKVHEYIEAKEPLLGTNHSYLGVYIDTEGWIDDVRVYSRPLSNSGISLGLSLPNGSPGESEPEEAINAFGNQLAGADGEDPQMFIKWKGPVRRNTSDARSGSASLMLSRVGIVAAPGLIKLDPSRCYEISGYFRSAQANQPSRMLLDVRFLTENKRPIDNWAIHPVSGVATILSDVLVGETKLRIARTDWPMPGRTFKLALHAKEDLSDLPNFLTLSISKYEVTETAYEVTLRKPVNETLPAGTKVRLHGYLDYPRVFDNKVPFEWTRYAFRLVDKAQAGNGKGKGSGNYLWPGAKYAQVVILHHYTNYPEPLPSNEPPPILLFDDIEFREIAAEKLNQP